MWPLSHGATPHAGVPHAPSLTPFLTLSLRSQPHLPSLGRTLVLTLLIPHTPPHLLQVCQGHLKHTALETLRGNLYPTHHIVHRVDSSITGRSNGNRQQQKQAAKQQLGQQLAWPCRMDGHTPHTTPTTPTRATAGLPCLMAPARVVKLVRAPCRCSVTGPHLTGPVFKWAAPVTFASSLTQTPSPAVAAAALGPPVPGTGPSCCEPPSRQ